MAEAIQFLSFSSFQLSVIENCPKIQNPSISHEKSQLYPIIPYYTILYQHFGWLSGYILFDSHEIPHFFSVKSGELQGTHSAETDLCWHCSAKGARQVGSAQAQELVGGNHLVTCLCHKKCSANQVINFLF